MSEVIKSYKGFNKDMTCIGFQYEEGKEYTTDKAVACKSGFHACEYPLDVFEYYKPSESIYCEVEQSGDISRDGNDSKIASSKIKIGASINIAGLVKASIEYIKAKCEKENNSDEDKKVIETTGSRSANSATGYGSANLSTGSECSNDSQGERNISIGWGRDNKCKGIVGSFLVLSEWDEWDGKKYPFISAKMVEVDGENIKADTWYKLVDGEIVEVKED